MEPIGCKLFCDTVRVCVTEVFTDDMFVGPKERLIVITSKSKGWHIEHPSILVETREAWIGLEKKIMKCFSDKELLNCFN